MDWDIKNKFCFTTWTALKIIGELHLNFIESQNVLMKELSFWQQAITEQQLKSNIEKTAGKFDEILRTIPTINYNNFSQPEIREKLSEHFSKEENTVHGLAELVNELYIIKDS